METLACFSLILGIVAADENDDVFEMCNILLKGDSLEIVLTKSHHLSIS